MKLRNRIFARFLDDGEKVLHVAHRHISIFLYKSFKAFFFGLAIPTVLYFLFPNLLIAWIIWGGVGLFGIIYHFLDWYFDVWLLTNSGIIDIERNGFFDITTTKIEYHMLEGVSYTVKGFWRTIFNFGEITVDKLGGKNSIVLEDAIKPKKLESKVLKYQDKFVVDRSVRDHQALKNMLSEMIAYHAQNQKIEKE
jgi:hypothetical protein